MSPELKEQIRAAARADGRPALPWILDVIRSALPPELELDDGQDSQQPQEDIRMAG